MGVVGFSHATNRTGRPLGDENFLTKLEGLLNRALKTKKAGRKPKIQEK